MDDRGSIAHKLVYFAATGYRDVFPKRQIIQSDSQSAAMGQSQSEGAMMNLSGQVCWFLQVPF